MLKESAFVSRNPTLFLNDIRQSCERIINYVHDLEFEDFCNDFKTYDAVVRNIEIIGEAVKNLPEETRSQYNGVEWKKISGLRDIMIHAYFGIDNEILWDVISTKIPALLKALSK